MDNKIDKQKMDTILQDCRQCGTCCKTYRKILLNPDEVERMKKLGANVGIMIRLNDLRTNNINDIAINEQQKGKVYMIHPDDKGCIFLEKRDDKYRCKIYHYRPEACKGFKCNMADETVNSLFMNDSIHLLGMNRFGQKLR